MKKYLIAFAVILLLTLSACSEQQAQNTTAVERYNAAVDSYLAEVQPYNEAITALHTELGGVLEEAKALLEGEIHAYDPSAMEALRSAMVEGANLGKAIPQPLKTYKYIEIPEKANSDALEQLSAKAEAALAQLEAAARPADAPIPDSAAILETLRASLKACQESIQLQKQITAPTDAFVMERLALVETIGEMEAVTEANDPNKALNTPGGYIGCIFFFDKQVDLTQFYDYQPEEGPLDLGFIGGGAIEIYKTVEDAQNRDNQLKMFDNTTVHTAGQTSFFEPGAHGVVGTVVIRTSSKLSEEAQQILLEAIGKALLAA